MSAVIRSTLWLGFFGVILISWYMMYVMATGMGLDLIGRPSGMMDMGSMGSGMQQDAMRGMEAMESEAGSGSMSGMADMEDGADQDGMAPMSMTNDMSTNMGATDASGAMGGMSGMGTEMAGDDMGMMDMSMMTRFSPLFGMWAAMMAAMMLPTMVPTLRAYEDLMASADGTRSGWVGVLLGYFVAWVAFAALITGAQLGLLRFGVIDMMGIARSHLVAAALLVVVGLFQFTRVKEICHGVCHSPMTYFLGHWKTGFSGGLRMGLGLGTFCVGCCWGFMALGFVGGVMSLLWMGLATLFMVIEKLPQIGHYVTKPAGAVLILGGVILAVYPVITGG